MNVMQNDYSRQVNILNPEEFKTPIHIIGAGATGSWVAFSLAKMGLTNITVYDFDEVGMHNLPNQMFGLRDIDRNKAISIRNIIKLFTGFNIKARNTKVEAGQPLQGIVFMLTDTMKSRRDIYNTSIKNNPNVDLLIETRMDLRGGRIYAIDPKNRIQKSRYEETFYLDEEAEVSACGVSQTVLPSALAITSHAIWKMLNFINDEYFANETIMDFGNEITFTSDFSIEKQEIQKKIKNRDFLKDLRDKVVCCRTETKAEEFMKLCKSEGIVWNSGKSPTEVNFWDVNKEDTCYYIDKCKKISYGSCNFFKRDYPDKEIYEF